MDYEKAHRLFRRAVEDNELCSWCFARKRILHPEYDEMEAHQLRWGATKKTMEAKGHRIRSDGGVDVDFSTSDPHPSTESDVPPATTIDGEYRRPSPRIICECGVVDHGSDNRSLSQLHTCVDNILDWFDRQGLTMYPDTIDATRCHDMVTRLRQYETMTGRDEVVLSESIRSGFYDSD